MSTKADEDGSELSEREAGTADEGASSEETAAPDAVEKVSSVRNKSERPASDEDASSIRNKSDAPPKRSEDATPGAAEDATSGPADDATSNRPDVAAADPLGSLSALGSLDDDDEFRTAADDPTAIWDEDALRAAGLSIPGAESSSGEAPSVRPKGTPMGPPRTIAIADDIIPTAPRPASPKAGLSWPLTIGLAVVVFVLVFTVVKLLQ